MATPLERFMSKCMPEPNTGCWIWLRCVSSWGYGRFSVGQRKMPAHRWAYEHFVGPVPDGMVLDHVRARGCCGPICVNPEHLEPVTQRENLLRGDTFQARNAAVTHCPRGHAYTAENTYLYRGRFRHCKTCRVERLRKWRASRH